MASKLLHNLLILPATHMDRTADYYVTKLNFKAVPYLQSTQPHICLYRDNVEIIVIQSQLHKIVPNRIMHGYGYDGYFTTTNVKELYEELVAKNISMIKPLQITDYGNMEFIFEDIDSRWICIGSKQ